MTRYVALLRGVNLLGGSTLKNDALKAIAKDAGLGSPRTFIASGNLSAYVDGSPLQEV